MHRSKRQSNSKYPLLIAKFFQLLALSCLVGFYSSALYGQTRTAPPPPPPVRLPPTLPSQHLKPIQPIQRIRPVQIEPRNPVRIDRVKPLNPNVNLQPATIPQQTQIERINTSPNALSAGPPPEPSPGDSGDSDDSDADEEESPSPSPSPDISPSPTIDPFESGMVEDASSPTPSLSPSQSASPTDSALSTSRWLLWLGLVGVGIVVVVVIASKRRSR